ncbi:hypothetical protein SAMN05216327_102348 [Dyadobacter sp. SG02]|uniref:hypothetical protein n=1 Tax=Dyadobacter sp. SG02 TaxID=1855291 RepID=UPI0008D0D781|nr:hypothetical protein [Dyadobacter sp. SG02]SEI54218.1 hypothetical protein SAMN05216327_102348 [Dyadobacter sp. SG02]
MKPTILSVLFLLTWMQIAGQDLKPGPVTKMLNPRLVIHPGYLGGIQWQKHTVTFDRAYYVFDDANRVFSYEEVLALKKQDYVNTNNKSDDFEWRTSLSIVKRQPGRNAPYLLTPHHFDTFPAVISLWNCEIPATYSIKIQRYVDEQPAGDTLLTQGLKIFSIARDIPSLNGKNINFKAIRYDVNRGAQLYKSDLLTLKRAFTNTVMVTQYDTSFLKACDDIGMYVILKLETGVAARYKDWKSISDSFQRLEYFNMQTFNGQGTGNPFRFGSLLCVVADSKDDILLKELNSLLSFYNRNEKNVFKASDKLFAELASKSPALDAVSSSEAEAKIISFIKSKYIPVNAYPIDLSKGTIRIHNKFDFTDLSGTEYHWILNRGENKLDEGKGIIDKLGAQSETDIKIFENIKSFESNHTYSLKITLKQAMQIYSAKEDIELSPIKFAVQALPEQTEIISP